MTSEATIQDLFQSINLARVEINQRRSRSRRRCETPTGDRSKMIYNSPLVFSEMKKPGSVARKDSNANQECVNPFLSRHLMRSNSNQALRENSKNIDLSQEKFYRSKQYLVPSYKKDGAALLVDRLQQKLKQAFRNILLYRNEGKNHKQPLINQKSNKELSQKDLGISQKKQNQPIERALNEVRKKIDEKKLEIAQKPLKVPFKSKQSTPRQEFPQYISATSITSKKQEIPWSAKLNYKQKNFMQRLEEARNNISSFVDYSSQNLSKSNKPGNLLLRNGGENQDNQDIEKLKKKYRQKFQQFQMQYLSQNSLRSFDCDRTQSQHLLASNLSNASQDIEDEIIQQLLEQQNAFEQVQAISLPTQEIQEQPSYSVKEESQEKI